MLTNILYIHIIYLYAIVAQSVEHYIGNVEVAGSIPAVSSMSPGPLSWGFFLFFAWAFFGFGGSFVAEAFYFHSRAVEFYLEKP